MTFENNPPFVIQEIHFQKWVAGVQGGGSGINVYLTLESIEEDVVFQTLYFRGKSSPLNSNPNTPKRYTANFLTDQNRDVIMDSNSLKESQNTPPEKIPFQLGDNDAVFSFTENGTLQYFKVKDIEEKPMLAYPAANNKQ